MKRFLTFALALCIIALTLCACSGGGTQDATDPSEAAPGSKYFFPEGINFDDFSDMDSFRILEWGETGGTHWSAFEFIYDESIDGDIVNDAVFERDRIIEDKFGLKIVYTVHDRDTIASVARNSTNSGSDDYDAISVNVLDAASMGRDGLLLDLNEHRDALDLDKDWWDPAVNDAVSFGGHLYFTTSDLTLVDKDAVWVVYFTKSLLSRYPALTDGYENGLFSMVESGDWTIEKMYDMIRTVSHDADGDSLMTEKDVYGHIGETFNTCALLVGCGSVAARKDENDLPVYCWSEMADTLSYCYDMIRPIVHDTNYSMVANRLSDLGFTEGDVWTDGFGALMQNEQALFNVTGTNRCRLYRGLECDFGIVPLPKANKEQENYMSFVHQKMSNCIAVPVSVKDPDKVCAVLNAMTCLASQTTYKQYLERAITYKYLKADTDSIAMLDIIFANRVFDPVELYGMGGCTTNTFYGIDPPKTGAVASSIEKMRKITEKSIEKCIKDMTKTDSES